MQVFQPCAYFENTNCLRGRTWLGDQTVRRCVWEMGSWILVRNLSRTSPVHILKTLIAYVGELGLGTRQLGGVCGDGESDTCA
ncbi:hypothetical protein CEXT_415581 [Caerostris extrusa]|uniref:Uncharacterized protein n=1 Tax=Caerostris extrusa TaxID=172846 RepID=A0AAV4S459_CAEEX|nr:hypothetical protein CEXT_415581 [Caerostris extrusa]